MNDLLKKRQIRIRNLLVRVSAMLAVTINVTAAAIPSPPQTIAAGKPYASLRIALRPPVHHAGDSGESSQADEEGRCLAEALYFAPRRNGDEGGRAIAEIIFNRLADGSHGASLCDVVHERSGSPRCPFAFACDTARPKLAGPWRAAQALAARLLAGAKPIADSHAVAARPAWAPTIQTIVQIGDHSFYPAPQKARAGAILFRGSLQ